MHIDKSLQESDWGVQPLSEAQLRYAACDVLYLHDLLDTLETHLAREGKLPLTVACYAHIPTRLAMDLGEYPDVYAY
jgi:ribonuclease D